MLTSIKTGLNLRICHLLNRRLSGAVQTVNIQEQKIRVGSIDINYVSSVAEGTNPTKTVVCLPGALGSAFTDFKPQIENLPKLLPNFKVIVWDPPGYGKSIPPGKQYTADFFEEDANVFKQLMDVLEIPKYSVLGWSGGGVTGMIIAGKYSANVEKLVIFGANAYFIDEELKRYQEIRDVSKWSPKKREPFEKLYGEEYFKTKWEEFVDNFKVIQKERNGDLCKKFLKHITAETLILHGEKDPMLAKEQVPYLLQHIAGSKLITWPEGKHNIHLRYAEEFNQKVANFLTK